MRSFQHVLHWLIVGSRGGFNRGRIIFSLEKEPMNAHSLSKKLGLDYKTIQYHIGVLLEHHLITNSGKKYGQVFFLSPKLQDNYALLKKLFETKFSKEIKNER